MSHFFFGQLTRFSNSAHQPIITTFKQTRAMQYYVDFDKTNLFLVTMHEITYPEKISRIDLFAWLRTRRSQTPYHNAIGDGVVLPRRHGQ
jgi:hypothetical protein